jgi:hypothetical protein
LQAALSIDRRLAAGPQLEEDRKRVALWVNEEATETAEL